MDLFANPLKSKPYTEMICTIIHELLGSSSFPTAGDSLSKEELLSFETEP